MGDYGMRGEAAQRLLKKGKKGAPPEDELGLPPEEGADDAPPAEGGDLAALLGAAGGAPPPGGAMPPDAGTPPMDEAMPPEEGMAEAQPQDFDTALGSVENSLESLPPEAAEEIRVHLNAIREIAAKAGSSPKQMQPSPEAPEGGAGTPLPPGPANEEMPQ